MVSNYVAIHLLVVGNTFIGRKKNGVGVQNSKYASLVGKPWIPVL